MKKIIGVLIIGIFLISMLPVSFAAESADASVESKKSSLIKVTTELGDYIESAKERVISSSLEDKEKEEIIKKLDEKKVIIESYKAEVYEVQSREEINPIKSKLKEEIKNIKPIVEDPIVKIHKNKISEIIAKLRILTGKLDKIKSNLDTEDKNKIEILELFIDEARGNLESAENIYRKNPKDITEVKALLNEATKNIKEAFSLIREILSEMESNLLLEDIGETSVKAKQTKISEMKETYNSMNPSIKINRIENIYTKIGEKFSLVDGQSAKVVSDDDRNIIISVKDSDGDKAILIINGEEELRQIEEGNVLSVKGYKIESIQVDYGQATFIVRKSDEGVEPETIDGGETEGGESTIIALLPGETHWEVTLVGTNVNERSCSIEYKGRISTIDIGESKTLRDLEVKVTTIVEDYCTLRLERIALPTGDITQQVLATGETVNGVTLVTVDVNGNSCTVEYKGITKTIADGSTKAMEDGTTVGVIDVIPTNRQSTPDYCELRLER